MQDLFGTPEVHPDLSKLMGLFGFSMQNLHGLSQPLECNTDETDASVWLISLSQQWN